jgi:hypothetical protein
MPTQTVSRSTADIARSGTLTLEAQILMADHSTPASFVQSLVQRRLYADALHFLCSWLPPREGAWWGCLCVWHVSRPALPEPARPAYQATVHWVQNPTEQHRQATARAAEAADAVNHPAVRLATAAALTDPTRAGNLLLSALLVAAARHRPLDATVTQREFVELGLEIAAGKNRWA